MNVSATLRILLIEIIENESKKEEKDINLRFDTFIHLREELSALMSNDSYLKFLRDPLYLQRYFNHRRFISK